MLREAPGPHDIQKKKETRHKEEDASSKMPSTAPWIAAPMGRSRQSCAVSAWKLKRQRSKRRQKEKTTREAKSTGKHKSSAVSRWLILVVVDGAPDTATVKFRWGITAVSEGDDIHKRS